MNENSKFISKRSKFKKNNKIQKLKKGKRETNKIIKIEYSNNINDNENTKKNVKIRNPGIDLIRIIAMIGIIYNHLIYQDAAKTKYSKFQHLKLLFVFLFWHNNGYALISGVIGYKTNKYSNLLYLWLIVFFYSVGLNIYFKNFRKNSIIKEDIFKEYFPVVFKRYWYFTAYFGMYLYLPIINKGIMYLSKSELKLVVFSILGILAFWRKYIDQKEDIFHIAGGFSLLWLLTIYITGAYIGKYNVVYTGIKKIIFCFIYLFSFISITLLYYKLYDNSLNNINGYYKRKILLKLKQILTEDYDSILKIIQSISITLFFLQINYNKYISKIISFLGPLTFGVYLIHNNHIVRDNIFNKIFYNTPYVSNSYSAIKLIMVIDLKVLIICMIIDYIRHVIFTVFRIKKICIFVEKMIFKIF